MLKYISRLLCLALVLGSLSLPALAAKKEKKPEVFPPSGNLTFEDAITRELNVTIDSEPLKVTEYEDFYTETDEESYAVNDRKTVQAGYGSSEYSQRKTNTVQKQK